ncbi:MAG: cell division protein FtsA [Candidatus Hydrogenedentota bacterium]
MAERDFVVGLDIGTTKVCAIIAEQGSDGEAEIIGVGVAPSEGLRKGVVVSLESTVKSITRAIEEAELMAGVEVESVYAGIAGGHIKGLNSRGVIAVSRPDREIVSADVERVIDAAKAISIPLDREVIHVLPKEFIIDDQEGIQNPVGMTGVRLEAEVHIVTAAVSLVQNIIKSITRAGFGVEDIVLDPLASGSAVLTNDEKELGVAMVDIGGGTTDICLFLNGAIWHTEVLTIGGGHVTKDISVGLRTPPDQAEKIKKEYGCAIEDIVSAEENIEVPGIGGRSTRKLPRKVLVEIIQPRMAEIFELINRVIKQSGYEDMLAAGMVITGGASAMQGTPQLAEKILDLPIRCGLPKGVSGLVDAVNSPAFATGVGLCQYALQNRDKMPGKTRFEGGDLFRSITNRMKEWFTEFF